LDAEKYNEHVLGMPYEGRALGKKHHRGPKALRRLIQAYDARLGWRGGGYLASWRVRRALRNGVDQVCPPFYRKIAKFLLLSIYAYVARAIGGRHAHVFFSAEARAILKEFRDADAVVFVPGGYFIAPSSDHTYWLRHAFCLVLARVNRKPIALSACSIGPFFGTANRWIAKKVLNWADVIVLREERSLEAVRQLGVNQAKLHLAADAAFTLPQCDQARRAQLAATYCNTGRKLYVGVSVRDYDFPQSKDPAAARKRYLDAVAELVAYVVREYSASVLFMPQCIMPELNDIAAAEQVAERVGETKDVVVLREDYSPEELKTLYGLMDVFVGVRMHANIFALGAGTPVLAIAYEPKTRGIMQMLDLERFVVNIDEVSADILKEKFDRLLEQQDEVRVHLEEVLPGVIARAEASAQLISDTIGHGRTACARIS